MLHRIRSLCGVMEMNRQNARAFIRAVRNSPLIKREICRSLFAEEVR
jgi:hypothetical protein